MPPQGPAEARPSWSPEPEAELSRRSDKARENAQAGRTISGEERIRRLRERSKQRRVR